MRWRPDVVRLRTLVPKINTPLLEDIQAGRFQMLSPHGVIRETMALIEAIAVAHPDGQRPLHQLRQRGGAPAGG